jgi:cell division protein ZapE
MFEESLKESFLKYCEEKKYEKNINQIEIIEHLINFIKSKKNFLNLIFKSKEKKCLYLYGDVGVGKTMILNYFYKSLKISKQRFHFNEFMINFHDFRHNNKKNSILSFVKDLKKKSHLIYLDEFQVTNSVDAMILGKLFQIIFKENIKVFMTSNIQIEDLYKGGLQRDQFLPFISILKKNSVQKKLIINEDYRELSSDKLQRAFYPINEKNVFKTNKLFRKITKNKKLKPFKLKIKGRDFLISEYYDGIAKFDFKELCETTIGAEDYIKIAEVCNFILINNIPNFNETSINQQLRFITLIDILYEKKVSLMTLMSSNFKNLGSSVKLKDQFKRTISRLVELTSPKVNYI